LMTGSNSFHSALSRPLYVWQRVAPLIPSSVIAISGFGMVSRGCLGFAEWICIVGKDLMWSEWCRQEEVSLMVLSKTAGVSESVDGNGVFRVLAEWMDSVLKSTEWMGID